MTQEPPKKGSIEQALEFWASNAPDLTHTINSLLQDVYNFQAVGASNIVTRSILMKDGRIFRIYGSLS